MKNKERSIEQIKSDLEKNAKSFRETMQQSTEVMQQIMNELNKLRGSQTKERSDDLTVNPFEKLILKSQYCGSDCGEAPEVPKNEMPISIYNYAHNKTGKLVFTYDGKEFIDLNINEYLYNCYNTKFSEHSDITEISNDFYFLGYVPARDKKALKFDANALLKQYRNNYFPTDVLNTHWFNLNEANFVLLAQYLLSDSYFLPSSEWESNLLNVNYKLTRDQIYIIISDPELFKSYCLNYFKNEDSSFYADKYQKYEMRDLLLNFDISMPDIDDAYLSDTDEYNFNTHTLKAIQKRSIINFFDFAYIELVLGRFLQCFIEAHIPLKDRKNNIEEQINDLDRYFKLY